MVLIRRVVYGFMGWFESFDSVWQTTLLCVGGVLFEDALPNLDPGHLVFLLLLSLYATFTQNALAHGNKLTSAKVDAALSTLITLGQTEQVLTEAMSEALGALKDALTDVSEDTDRLIEGLK